MKAKPREQIRGMWGISETMWYHNCGGAIKFLAQNVKTCLECNITFSDVKDWKRKKEEKKKKRGRTKKA